MYKMMKVFDSQDMPDDVRKLFFETSEQGNYCYVSREVMLPTYVSDDETGEVTACDEYNIIDAWLLNSGALGGDYVLIQHWW